MKKYLIAAAFAVVAASPALAASQGQHHRRTATAESSYAYAAPYAETAVVNGKVVGRDPDAFIRQSLVRAGDPTEQSGGN